MRGRRVSMFELRPTSSGAREIGDLGGELVELDDSLAASEPAHLLGDAGRREPVRSRRDGIGVDADLDDIDLRLDDDASISSSVRMRS